MSNKGIKHTRAIAKEVPKDNSPFTTGQLVASWLSVALAAIAIGVVIWARRDFPPAIVRLDVRTDNMTFFCRPDDARRALRAFPTSAVEVKNFRRVDLGPGEIRSGPQYGPSRKPIIEPSAVGASLSVEESHIADIEFPSTSSAARVTLQWADGDPNVVTVQLWPVQSLRLNARRTRTINCDYCRISGFASSPSQRFTFASTDPDELRILAVNNTLTIGLELQKPKSWNLTDVFVVNPPTDFKGSITNPIRAIDFRHADDNRTLTSILEGTLYFQDTADEDYKGLSLPAAKILTLDRLQDFRILEVRLQDGLKVTAEGSVGILKVGEVNKLPSRLTRWNRSEPVTITGITAIAINLCYTVVTWLGVFRKNQVKP